MTDDLGKFFADLAWDKLRTRDSQRPRSVQKALGPSEIAGPCERRIALKISGAESSNPMGGSGWEAIVGTAVHAHIEKALASDPAWVTEKRLDINGVTQGTSDAFHLPTGTVVDWKIVGKNTLDEAKRRGPGPKYEGQGQSYGLGWEQAGFEVKTVCIVFLPRAQSIDNRFGWTTPYSREKALEVLDRYQRIVRDYKGKPQEAPIDTSGCRFCPFWNPQLAATHPDRACNAGKKPAEPVSMLD